MGVKKGKRIRRAVRFYSVCFGFRKPFKILCDGNFVHHLVANRITPADTALANTLGSPVKMFTTRCVLAELKSLGDSFSESLNAARNLMIARCDHEKRKTADACLTEVIGEKNTEHFFVATQDKELRKKFQEIPGVPVMYGINNTLSLESPSTFQHQVAKAAEEERLHTTDLEYKMLRKVKKGVSTDEARDSSEANEDNKDHNYVKRNRTETKDRPQFKRKRAKGPNPLSCKKKKNRTQ